MVVTKVVTFILGQLQAMVSLSVITLSVLTNEQEHENNGDADAHTDNANQYRKGCREIRGFASEEDVAGDDATEICEANLNCNTDGSLVMATHVVVDPAHCERCPGGTARAQEEDSHISHTDGDPRTCEHDDQGEKSPKVHGDDEPEAMLGKVGQHCDHDGQGASNHEDGDCHDLRAQRRPSKAVQESRRE